MNYSKFEVGEDCWLVSPNFPEYQWVKVKVLAKKFCRYEVNGVRHMEPQWGYDIGILGPVNGAQWWSETSLRKINPDTLQSCGEGWSLESLKGDIHAEGQ